LQHHDTPANSARELFKPSTVSASLLVSIKKKYLIWVRDSLGETSQSGAVFEFLTNFDWSGRQSNKPFFGSKFIWKLGDYPHL